LTRFVALIALSASVAAVAADAQHGQALYESRCIGCHSLDSNRVGPAHRGLFGRRAGTVPGYGYSAALRNARFAWDEATLKQWSADPERLVPGQRMNYSVPQPEDRADLIAYLQRAN
jgi:cytochrome c